MHYRKSRQRERILQLLRETRAHPTADWIYKKLKNEIPELSLGTVYRNLKVLIDQGKVRKLPFGSTFDRYEAGTEPHYHLVCEQCGAVTDFQMPQYKTIHKKAELMSSFKIHSHRIDFFGICEKCQTTLKKKERRKHYGSRK
ncbi:MAG: transcriptional repressor [Chitinivibrionales bacterium]|nr:transcriptional repressor [Chitinivibrionales bacterium]